MNIVAYCIRLPQIEKDLKALSKRFKSASNDLVHVERLLEVGYKLPQTDQYTGFGENHNIFKTRVINTNTNKGKSSGYRLIYEEISNSREKQILLIFLYDKHTCNNEGKVRIEVKTRLHSPEYQTLTCVSNGSSS